MDLDHALIAVADLETAGRELQTRYGLASIEGGRHPGWGTANRIVPLGDAYIELIAVVDEAQAAQTTVGRWVASGASDRYKPLGWVVRTNELEQVARRLGLSMGAGSRTAPSGQRLRWRSAGIEQAVAEPSFPFFIEWGRGTKLPGRTAVRHRASPATIMKLVLHADPERLETWLGDHSLPIVVRPGSPAVASIVLSGAAGEIVLGHH